MDRQDVTIDANNNKMRKRAYIVDDETGREDGGTGASSASPLHLHGKGLGFGKVSLPRLTQ